MDLALMEKLDFLLSHSQGKHIYIAVFNRDYTYV